jgi:hypothetical protein
MSTDIRDMAQPEEEGWAWSELTRTLLHPAYEPAWAPGEEIAEGAQLVDRQWWHPIMGCDSLQIVVDNARAALAQPEEEGWAVKGLRELSEAFHDQFFLVDDGLSPRLIKAANEAQRLLLTKGRPAAPPALPPGFVDPEHQGESAKLLEIFYQACQAEGGTSDEIHLRGIRAVLAACPAAPPAPEVGEMEGQ